jgi:hypothetical protein
MARQEDNAVMLSAAEHLEAHGERPFAAAQGDNQGSSVRDNAVMLSGAKHLEADGILDLCLRLMRIG